MKYRTRKRPMISNRKGSALLIVLGMFAFMLVSAVSFSIYMRASRAPSSYVRRNASARQLVKAALARAIDEIDMAIGNDPFPGVGYHSYKSRKGAEPIPQDRNDKEWFDQYKGMNDNWHGRVFTPAGAVPAKDTVSTLTLEALGYIPPHLVNDVRYWSRHTRTAKWHPFSYGLGQYAFTAINVSDFFDLGALAGKDNGQERQYLNRSSAPHGRISPTYLFRGGAKIDEQKDLTKGKDKAKSFLEALSESLASPSEVPLVSLMDFNLSYRSSEFAVEPPFLAESGGYLNGKISRENALAQVFVAGGWNGNELFSTIPKSVGGLDRIDLSDPKYQPFAGYGWFPDATTLSHCYNDVSENHPFWLPLNKDFPILSTALLCDYLDYDNVPLSLCIPCTEAVPMICGVELNPQSLTYSVSYNDVLDTPANQQNPNNIFKRTYSLNVDVNNIEVTVTTVHPFINGRDGKSKELYTVEAFARVFFTVEPSNEDADLNDAGLRCPVGLLGAVDDTQWGNTDVSRAEYVQTFCKTPRPESLLINAAMGNGEAAEKSVITMRSGSRQSSTSLKMGAVTKNGAIGEVKYSVNQNTPNVRTVVQNSGVGYDNSFKFFDNWTSVDAKTIGQSFEQTFGNANNPNPNLKIRPTVAVWVRIKNMAGRTVDLVPAVPVNDVLNNMAANDGLKGFKQATGGNAGDPLIRYFPLKGNPYAIGAIEFTDGYFNNQNAKVHNVDWKQKAYIANDPRINWAPEQWWATASIADPGNLWFDNVKTFRKNNSWCDSDIFMSVSDQGYMQSVYEWMLIPQVLRVRQRADDDNANNANLEWGVFESGSGYDGIVNIRVEDVSYSDVMWRTYRSRAFLEGSDNWDWGRIDLLPFEERVVGLRVNPYTDITNIMMGAFANMPRDWWAAGTNKTVSGKDYMDPSAYSFNPNYLFDWSCNYDDVYKMSKFWMSSFTHQSDNFSRNSDLLDRWSERLDGYLNGSVDVVNGFTGGSFNIVDWFNGDVLLNLTDNFADDVQAILQQDLTLADRKFLYGYLKGCFANTHQLFLVFVRAETAAGGGGAGSGARAVALVYRDPKAPSNGGLPVDGVNKDNASIYLSIDDDEEDEFSWHLKKREYPPHKSHVLFYHQLD